MLSANADGGLALTTVPERWKASWPDNLAAARIGDDGGLDFFLPIARWAGFGGATRARERSFETFTWAAGLAAATRRTAIFATVHVPLVHPVYAAKALATIDQISGGRAGLNIVCGWNPAEFAMFGATPDERGYERAAEWIHIVECSWSDDAPFDFDGQYYRLEGVISRPASVQRPRPVTMNAAFGAPGRDFAARHCDILFSTFTDIADGRRHLADIRARSAAAGRAKHTRCAMSCAGRAGRRPRTPTTAMRYARPTTPLSTTTWPARSSFGLARRARLSRLPPALRRRRRHLSAGRIAR